MRLELPAERQFDDVRQFLQKNGVHDLAQLISQVRNNVIHPPRREAQVERVPVEVRIDASRLAIWALEMSLVSCSTIEVSMQIVGETSIRPMPCHGSRLRSAHRAVSRFASLL